MSDIKNLFADTFKGFNLSQFPRSDLKKIGYEWKEINHNVKQQVKRCPHRKQQPKKTEEEKFFNRNKIIPLEPRPNEQKHRFKYKHFNQGSIVKEMELNKNRHKLYYHSHREELKWKRLVKEGRYDVIEKLLNSLPD
jgi:hypothetical protein